MGRELITDEINRWRGPIRARIMRVIGRCSDEFGIYWLFYFFHRGGQQNAERGEEGGRGRFQKMPGETGEKIASKNFFTCRERQKGNQRGRIFTHIRRKRNHQRGREAKKNQGRGLIDGKRGGRKSARATFHQYPQKREEGRRDMTRGSRWTGGFAECIAVDRKPCEGIPRSASNWDYRRRIRRGEEVGTIP